MNIKFLTQEQNKKIKVYMPRLLILFVLVFYPLVAIYIQKSKYNDIDLDPFSIIYDPYYELRYGDKAMIRKFYRHEEILNKMVQEIEDKKSIGVSVDGNYDRYGTFYYHPYSKNLEKMKFDSLSRYDGSNYVRFTKRVGFLSSEGRSNIGYIYVYNGDPPQDTYHRKLIHIKDSWYLIRF